MNCTIIGIQAVPPTSLRDAAGGAAISCLQYERYPSLLLLVYRYLREARQMSRPASRRPIFIAAKKPKYCEQRPSVLLCPASWSRIVFHPRPRRLLMILPQTCRLHSSVFGFQADATPCGETSSWPISYSHTSLKICSPDEDETDQDMCCERQEQQPGRPCAASMPQGKEETRKNRKLVHLLLLTVRAAVPKYRVDR